MSGRRSERETIEDIIKELSPYSVTTTDANDKTIRTPASGKRFRVGFIYVWNASGGGLTINGFRFGDGTYHFKGKLSDATGFLMNVVGANWKGAVNEEFMVKASGAGLEVTVFGEDT